MRIKTYIISAIFSVFFAQSAFAEEAYTLEKIVVKSAGSAFDKFNENSAFYSINSAQIEEDNPDSFIDELGLVSGVDLRNRSSFGMQGDLSLRGSTYEEVAVLVDGIRLNDPQTGHYNLDLPLSAYDIEKIDITKEGSSSKYGAGAFAGSVNITPKRPLKNSINIDTLFGENALFGQGFSAQGIKGGLSGRVSYEHKISKAARPNTDFEYQIASLYLDKQFSKIDLNSLFGYQKKDYGASSFYSNNFPEEEEHTETLFFKTGINPKLETGSLKNNIFLRKHKDKFILQRNNPTSVNYHTTYIYGLNSRYSLPTKYGILNLGLDIGNDQINSTNLGKHSRAYEAGLLGFSPKLTDRLSADFRVRMDYYQKWGGQESYNVDLGYELIEDKLKIKGSVSRAFRIPSFTELYYSDAANKGDPNLKVETNDNFRLGADFKNKILYLGADIFLRRGYNLIDYTRTLTTDLWQATNLGQVDFKGIEFISQINPKWKYKGLLLERAQFSYNYTSADRKASGFFSKYALDILQHQYLLDIYSDIFGLKFIWQLSYNQRYYSDSYFVGNISISKKLNFKEFSLEPFLRIDNFTNKSYSEIAGVEEPGRWIKGGVKFEW